MMKYIVNVDMKFSHDVFVSAKNKVEAKKKAFVKFQKTKASKKRNYDVSVVDEE